MQATNQETRKKSKSKSESSIDRDLKIYGMKAQGLSYREIARELGIHHSTVSAIAGWFCIVLLLALSGCNDRSMVRALPAPSPEAPSANIPKELHQKNWLGPSREGSCVYASLTAHARWQNNFALAAWARQQGDGEYASRLRQKLDQVGVKYAYTEQARAEFLDWCDNTRRGCILWWKPSHCCTFVGYVKKDGKTYCAILDNNYPGKFELTERSQFLRLWAGYGGFGLAVLGDPASPLPWLSYEEVW